MADRSCPSCRAAVESDQEYCLECGARLPSPWGERHPPPPWIWLALGALALVALVSGVVVAVLATHDEDPVAAVVAQPPIAGDPVAPPPAVAPEPAPAPPPPPASDTVLTESVPPTVSEIGPPDESDPFTDTIELTGTDGLGESGIDDTTDTTDTTETTETTETTDDTTDGETETDGSDDGELIEWPSGDGEFTVVLASVPEARGESAATAQAERALANGLTEVGVLRSDDYPNLSPGYWVVFAGVYSTLAEARSALGDAQGSGFPGAYTRRVGS